MTFAARRYPRCCGGMPMRRWLSPYVHAAVVGTFVILGCMSDAIRIYSLAVTAIVHHPSQTVTGSPLVALRSATYLPSISCLQIWPTLTSRACSIASYDAFMAGLPAPWLRARRAGSQLVTRACPGVARPAGKFSLGRLDRKAGPAERSYAGPGGWVAAERSCRDLPVGVDVGDRGGRGHAAGRPPRGECVREGEASRLWHGRQVTGHGQ